MEFTELIARISPGIPVEIRNALGTFEISDVELIDGRQKEYRQATVYFGFYEQLAIPELPVQCVLARTSDSQALIAASGNLALAEAQTIFSLFNNAKTLLEEAKGRSLYVELLDCAAKTQRLEALANLAAARLGNSVLILDSDFRILAHSKIFPIEDSLWAEYILQGYCSYEFVRAIAQLDSVRTAPPTSEPVVVTCQASPLRKLSSKIFQDGRRIGTLLMLEKECPISPAHLELLPQAAAAIGETLVKSFPYLIEANDVHQKVLYDLLIGAEAEDLADQLAGLELSPQLCALCLKPQGGKSLKQLKQAVGKDLSLALPELHFSFHDASFAALLGLGNKIEVSAENIATLETLAQRHSLRVGVSAAFSRIEDFALYYGQASKAIGLAEERNQKSPVCRYSEYVFRDLLGNLRDQAKLSAFIHPSLPFLESYDRRNDTELYLTLKTYLESGGNAKETAIRLSIHRNSLAYRLDRIREITKVNLGDSTTLFLLSMSYQISDYISAPKPGAEPYSSAGKTRSKRAPPGF